MLYSAECIVLEDDEAREAIDGESKACSITKTNTNLIESSM